MGSRCARLAVVVLIAAAGACRNASPAPVSSPPTEHQHKAPHSGQLVELGEEFAHLELLLDRGAGKLTAYVLDGEAEQSVRISQPALTLLCTAPPGIAGKSFDLVPVTNVLTGEKIGDSSEFAVTDPSLRDLQNVEGRILRVTIKGQEFRDVPFKATF
jgi:hypothetical protein